MTKPVNHKDKNLPIIQSMIDNFELQWNNIALIGNRGHQNFWDELILIGNIKLIDTTYHSRYDELATNKSDHNTSSKPPKLIIYTANIPWLRWFHSYFNISWSRLIYTQELPHGFRSLLHYIFNPSCIKDIKYWFMTDTYILGGGEIFTPETPFSYQYRTISLMPYFFGKLFWWMRWCRPRLIVMWGIQKPTRWIDRVCFWLIWRCTDRFYLRDKESIEVIHTTRPYKEASVFVDSSYFAVSDICKKNSDEKIAIFNTNPLSDNFDTTISKIVEYSGRWYKVYFLPAYFTTHGAQDDMSVYDKVCVALWDADIDLQLLDWRDWDRFLDIFVKADFVYASRLHIYIVARLIGLDIEPFKYQKKLQKMIDMLDSVWL